VNDLESLRQLASALIDGTASSTDAERLSAMLRDHPEWRDAYLEYLDTHAALCWHFRDRAATLSQDQPAAVPVVTRRRSLVLTLFPWLVAGVAAAIAVVAILRPGESPRVVPIGSGVENPETSNGSVAALLVDEAGAEFAPNGGPQGVRFGPGSYELRRGIVHLRFAHGADMVLAAPARLEVKDAQHVRLVAGRIRVTAPPTAKGFTVATPDANFVDLGTEFGLRVDPASRACDLYVFDGQVNVTDPRSGEERPVLGGQSSRTVDGRPMAAPPLREGDFPTPGSIGLKRWEEYERRLREDHTLLAFFPFRRQADETVLANAVAGDMEDGQITGARWTTGRWQGKDGLLFDRDTDFAQVTIPGEHQELTIAAWVKVERIDFVLNAILNSDGADQGGIHFQLNRQGFVRGGLIVQGPFRDTFVGKPVPLGQWTHVASVISARTRSQQIYVNGALARERRWQSDVPLKPGPCRIGNWLPDPKDKFRTRALRGQIDELAVWGRALSEADVKHLVEDGRPGFLWNVK
jgi:hypothetical protein